MARMSRYAIRLYGDPVLRQRASEVDTIDGSLKQLADDMAQTMYEAPGVGLAAPQVGVQKRVFVYDTGDGDGPVTVVNPVLAEARGEWTYDEGCLSVPGLSWPIVRPKEVHLTGYDPFLVTVTPTQYERAHESRAREVLGDARSKASAAGVSKRPKPNRLTSPAYATLASRPFSPKASAASLSTIVQSLRWLTPPARATPSLPGFSLRGCPARTFKSRSRVLRCSS